ncbi:uroporphyrinogen-III C-methyltransferase [Microbacterium pygmaeum]|uniref:uroporphyrinogen-III C-methyltransferase n=1 Tax=Microbacterium pygmaeum TaxID=370764 RepID=A0A1G7WKI4_9MICO|nr:uroporphyrinogen-III C-methyltransferase [Microbacterium pygmaeum]SDG72436.1 uroporphyrinogen-III C-methyltransferase [Microbacterium pygmaeum]
MTTMMGISLGGRLVLSVGGGDVAARRIRRFLLDGAVVRVVAPELGEQTARMVAENTLEWHAREVEPADLDGAWLVHTATGNARVDGRVAALCDERRILCVNAGSGAHGSARLAAETRSGDSIVGVVSDSGVDPGRTGALRDAIADRLREGGLPVRRRRPTSVGHVHLVGGGPGPVDLLTVRGRRLLAEADVVIVDRLGPVAVLDELSPEVEIIDVGKRPTHHPVPQSEINELLIDRARRGLRVVRLKGGDPFVYGRGGEEVEACLAAGVPVDVVPGLTSIVSVPEAAGIPVTHRGTAAALHVVNGQDSPTDATLAALRDPQTTTVVLMGVSALTRFADAALSAGADPSLPVAIVESGHTDAQRTTRAPLADIAERARVTGVANPAVMVFGHVAAAELLLPALGTNGTPARTSVSAGQSR